MTTLSTFVEKTMREKRISGYEVERRTKKGITQSYVNRIKNGEIQNPAPAKLRALARGLEVPEETVFSFIYDGKTDRKVPAIIASYANELPKAVQEDLLEIVKSLHRKYKK
jgi:transcriptional regulator with XRE-family HTH domain